MTRAEQTRARIVDAAREIFEDHGLMAARIADIVASAGVAYGTFYHYFASKDEVFLEVARSEEQNLAGVVHLVDGSGSIVEYIELLVAHYLMDYQAAAKLMHAIEVVSRYDAQVHEVHSATHDTLTAEVREKIAQLQRLGRVRSGLDAAIVADLLVAMMERFAELWTSREHDAYELDDVVEQMACVWARSLGLQDRLDEAS